MMVTARALRLVASSRPSSTANVVNIQAAVLPRSRRLLSGASTVSTTEASGAGDPALHSGDAPSEEYTDRPPRFSAAAEEAEAASASSPTGGAGGGLHHHQAQGKPSGMKQERVPPFGPSAKLGGTQELADAAAGSSFTPRRRFSSGRDAREEATPGRAESAARKVREEDREYYRTHKPSPLAELEFADTRKPVTRATDGGAADRLADVEGCTVQDTADDSLARAEDMFREARERGVPEWPHSRALAQMLARRSGRDHDHAPSSS